MVLKNVKSLSQAELFKYKQRYKAQLLDPDNNLILDMTIGLLEDIEKEIMKRKQGSK